MSDQPRPVWLTREQYNMLRSLMQTWPGVAKPIVAAWDAAPTDAAEAVAVAVDGVCPDYPRLGSYDARMKQEHALRRDIEGAVLRALGMPEREAS